MQGKPKTYAEVLNEDRTEILGKLRACGMVLLRSMSRDHDEYIVQIGAHQEWLEVKAAEIRLPVKVKPRPALPSMRHDCP